ncbi:MAG: hypothetical protein HFI08_04185 [Bacilli bacterium]|jgi:hypothetical protein|nr:hypothetical protein [Bacilli bacterium]
MAREIKTKELKNAKLATNYGGWMYCTGCNTNIGYLCYVTYDKINFSFTCKCQTKGKVLIDFEDSLDGTKTSDELILKKNRWCCKKEEEPLITIMDQKLEDYQLEITCKTCHQKYFKNKS